MAKNKSNHEKVEVEAVEEVAKESIEAVIPEEKPKMPQFKNVGNGIKIKVVEGKTFRWITVKKGQVVTIPRKIALRNKLVEVE